MPAITRAQIKKMNASISAHVTEQVASPNTNDYQYPTRPNVCMENEYHYFDYFHILKCTKLALFDKINLIHIELLTKSETEVLLHILDWKIIGQKICYEQDDDGRYHTLSEKEWEEAKAFSQLLRAPNKAYTYIYNLCLDGQFDKVEMSDVDLFNILEMEALKRMLTEIIQTGVSKYHWESPIIYTQQHIEKALVLLRYVNRTFYKNEKEVEKEVQKEVQKEMQPNIQFEIIKQSNNHKSEESIVLKHNEKTYYVYYYIYFQVIDGNFVVKKVDDFYIKNEKGHRIIGKNIINAAKKLVREIQLGKPRFNGIALSSEPFLL